MPLKIVLSDDKCAEAAARRGSAAAWDHGLMVHEIWSHALLNRAHVWIERVASDDNASDLPSREKYWLMEEMEARWRPPLIAKSAIVGVIL